MHATKKSVATLAARHGSVCTSADRPAPNLVSSKGYLCILQLRVYNLFGIDICFA